MLSDLRFAFRQIGKSPGFTATVIVILALGIGACTTVFSVVNTMLFPSFTRVEPQRLVTLRKTRLPDIPDGRASVPDLLDWKAQALSFAALAASSYTSLNLTNEGEPQRLSAQRITANFFDVLGIKLALGRAFVPDEETPGRNRVVILSHGLWQTTFGGTPDVIGRAIQLNAEPYTIVGVAPQDFDPPGDRPIRLLGSYAMVPLAFTDAERSNRAYAVLNVDARLKPGVTVAQAQSEMDVLTARLAEQHPEAKGAGALVMLTSDFRTRRMRPVLWSLLGAVGCVLLIACANVANLLLARATVRQRELSLRAALGAGRARLIRQLLAENLLLALAGGAAGALLAVWAIKALASTPTNAVMAQLALIRPDTGMLLFTVGLSVVTGLVFGFAPAWLASRVNLNEVLKQGTRGSTGSGARNRLRQGLVVTEVACSLILLASTGLLTRSFVKLAQVDPGFAPEHVASLQLFLRGQKYATQGIVAKPEPVLAFSEALLERLRALPGVEAAGVTFSVPMADAPMNRRFVIEGRAPLDPGDQPGAIWSSASPDYFSAMGIPRLRGRGFSAQDHAQAPPVVLINETMARQYFPDGDAIGQRIDVDPAPDSTRWREIVGIVADVSRGLDLTTPSQIYEPFAQAPVTLLNFVVKVSGDPAAIVPSLKTQVYAVDPNQPVAFVRLLSDVVDNSIARQRFAIKLLAAFSGIALVIAAVGIYGVIAYTVGQRTTEIGIRMALGAQAHDVLRLVLLHGARLVGLGLALGFVGALAAGQWLQSQLFQTSPHDLLTLGGITAFFASITAFACWLPARRAMRISPLEALRAE